MRAFIGAATLRGVAWYWIIGISVLNVLTLIGVHDPIAIVATVIAIFVAPPPPAWWFGG